MSECRCWNCLTHHNGDYGACENCSTVGRDRPLHVEAGTQLCAANKR